MKLNRRKIISIFLLFLFSGSIFISAANIFMQPKPPAAEIAVIKTSMGTIEIELDRENAPVTVENFIAYANADYYDGLVFHRVMSGFMIQGGGFDTDGVLKETSDPIVLEANNGLSNVVGTISMARSQDPDSATSQFFINTAENTFLNYQNAESPGYTVFGKVVKGLDIVQAIEAVEVTTKDATYPDYGIPVPSENWPAENVIIESITIK